MLVGREHKKSWMAWRRRSNMERTRQPCPFVDCGSRDAFTYNTEKMVGKCFSCDSGYPSKAGREVFDWAYEDYPTSHMNSGERNTMPTTQNVWTRTGTNLTEASAAGYRGVTPATMKLYGVKSVVDRQSAESVGHAYPYPSGGFKVRKYPKDFFVDNFKSDELFGMDKFNSGSSKVVVVTEGELDAMSGYQMTGSKYPFVSLPSATPSRKLWQNEKVMKFLKSFDKILMSVDSDGKSNGIVNKLSILFPNKVYVVPHDKYKDANEFLEAGASAAYNSAFFNAKKYVPENVFNTTEQFLKIVNEDEDSSYLPTYIQGFDDLALGLMRGHFTVFSAPEGIGKQLPNDTPIPTPGGFTTMGQLERGDVVYGDDGKPTKVTAITETQHDVPCYKVTFADGSTQVAGGPHRWGVFTTDNTYKVKTTEEMLEEGVLRGEGVAKFSVPICQPVDYQEAELPIDPWILGMWLGDGHSASQSIFVGYDDVQQFEALVDVTRRKDERTSVNYWVNGLSFKALREEGLINNKHIPEKFLLASVEDRVALLQGLMDSDGSPQGVGCEFYSSRLGLVEDFMELARSLGYKCRLREKQAVVNGKDYGPTYTVWFLAYGDTPIFRYERKQEKVKYCKTNRATRKTIRKIEPVASVPSRCLTVGNDSSLFLCGRHYTVTHNTEFMRKLEYTMLRSYPEVPIAICHMEETKKRSILGLVSYWVNKNVTRTDLIDDKQEVDTAIKEMSERENLFQFSLGVDEDPMSILDRIRYFAEGCGCQYIFFEPIQDLAYSRQTDQSTEAWLSELSTKLARLASELNVGIVTIAHENDDGQIRDCRMIGKRASVVVRLKRDKMHEDEDERNTTELLLVKNRPAGATGCAGWLKFDEESFTLHEVSLENEI